MNEKESSKLYYCFLIFFPYFFIVMISFMLILMIFSPESVKVNDEIVSQHSTSSFVVMGMFLISLIFLQKLIRSKIAHVEFRRENIVYTQNKENNYSDYSNVESIKKLPFICPPIYRIKFKNEQKSIYFIMANYFFICVVFWSWDFSWIEKYVNDKINKR